MHETLAFYTLSTNYVDHQNSQFFKNIVADLIFCTGFLKGNAWKSLFKILGKHFWVDFQTT